MQTVTARRREKMKKSRGDRKTILLFDGQSKCAQLMEHCSPAKPTVLWPPGEMSLSWLFPEKGTDWTFFSLELQPQKDWKN